MRLNPGDSLPAPRSDPRRKVVAGCLGLGLVLWLFGLGASASANEPVFTTFDPSGSASTWATGINQAGEITGYYVSEEGNPSYPGYAIYHGFLRSRDGTMLTFDPVGSIQTFARCINAQGVVAGTSWDGDGFVRSRDGAITTFDPPTASSAIWWEVWPTSINS